ncbi:hypothetical protein [Castellaniella sp.]|uniref:hypothetical protein n=1 Tax=Castellaniella sp. TaxID=1955812 RepID=UPI002AFF7BA6|nr:hypothetical protein [Castellaniella sp.]
MSNTQALAAFSQRAIVTAVKVAVDAIAEERMPPSYQDPTAHDAIEAYTETIQRYIEREKALWINDSVCLTADFLRRMVGFLILVAASSDNTVSIPYDDALKILELHNAFSGNTAMTRALNVVL